MIPRTKVEALIEVIQNLANSTPEFFAIKGPGKGNLATNVFIDEVRKFSHEFMWQDFAEQKICGDSGMAVDFYFQDEATIVELALGIHTPNSEFEKDILKALLAQSNYPVQRLVLIGKPGAHKKCLQPGRKAIRDWAFLQHGLTIDVYDIENKHK